MFQITDVFSTVTKNTKTIHYFNVEYVVPNWVCCIGCDVNGRVSGYSRKPDKIKWGRWEFYGEYFYYEMGWVSFNGDWINSLVEV